MNETHAPLDGIRVIAISQFGAGPYATMLLADLGAEIIKIEDPQSGGDVARYIPPGAQDGDSLYFQSFNRGKKSLTLDLRTDAGRSVFDDLVRRSHAVFNNLRGDLPEKLGLTYEQLKHLRPDIVTCSLTGFGRTGPRHAEPGYDALIQAYAGYMDLTGDPDSPPVKAGVSIIDFAGGMSAALALTAGILDAQRTGTGRDIDVGLLDTGISMLTYMATWQLNSDWRAGRVASSGHQTIVPAQNFRTADGWVSVFCAKESFWRELADGLGLPELKDDERFMTFADRYENRAELLPVLERKFRERTSAEWLDTLRGRTPIAPVNTLEQALSDPQVAARGLVVETTHPRLGTVRQVGAPFKTAGMPDPAPAPSLGEHNDEILTRVLGYSEEQAERLARDGAFGAAGE